MKIIRLIQKIFNNFVKRQDLRAKTKFVAVLIGTRYNEILVPKFLRTPCTN